MGLEPISWDWKSHELAPYSNPTFLCISLWQLAHTRIHLLNSVSTFSLFFSGDSRSWTSLAGFSVLCIYHICQVSKWLILVHPSLSLISQELQPLLTSFQVKVGMVGFKPTVYHSARFTVWCPSIIWAASPYIISSTSWKGMSHLLIPTAIFQVMLYHKILGKHTLYTSKHYF